MPLTIARATGTEPPLPSPIYLHRDPSSLTFTLSVIWSVEGVKQGCPWGTFLYCTTIMSALNRLATKHPLVRVVAQCDDVVKIVSPHSFQSHAQMYEAIAAFTADEDLEFGAMKQVRHPDKCSITIPAGVDPPARGVLDVNGIVCSVVDGHTVSGIPFGSEQYVTSQAIDKARLAAANLARISSLSVIDPHMAMCLLSSSVRGLQYFWSLTPPRLCVEAYRIFDRAMHDARIKVASLDNCISPACTTDREDRFHFLLSLPLTVGGAGHTPARVIGVCAYVAKLITLSAYPPLRPSLAVLAVDAAYAHSELCSLLQIDSPKRGTSLANFLPHNPLDLVSGPFAPKLASRKFLGLMGILTKAVDVVRFHDFRSTLLDEEAIDKPSATHLLAVLMRSQASRVFACSHFWTRNRIPKVDFVYWLRYYGNLPRIPTGGAPAAIAGCDVAGEICSNPHASGNNVIGPTGDHVVACAGSKGAIYRLHTLVRESLIFAAKHAGLSADREPATAKLLHHAYTDAQARGLFPKNPSKAMKQLAEELDGLLQSASACSDEMEKLRFIKEAEAKASTRFFAAQGRRHGMDPCCQPSDHKRLPLIGSTHAKAPAVALREAPWRAPSRLP